MRTLAALFALGLASSAAAEEFVPGIPDLPLMPGLAVADPVPVVFDKPGGRIVEAAALGASSPAAGARFYRATLPQLGWTPGPEERYDALSYARENETLRIEMGEDGTVRFLLAPR